jgi:hypothetical protein
MCLQARIDKQKLYSVYDDDSQIINDMHRDHDFACHLVIIRPNDSYQPVDAIDQNHVG